MNIRFHTKINLYKKYRYFIVPYDFCTNNNIGVHDNLLIKIDDIIFHTYISGTNSSKRINLPTNLLCELKRGDSICVEVVDKYQQRNHKIKIIKNNNECFLDLYHSLPKYQDHVKSEIIVFKLNDRLLVSSKNVSKQIIINRYLPLNEKTFEIFGLYQGEGTKKHKRDCAQIKFVNSNIKLINLLIEYFKDTFNIPFDKWSGRIFYVGSEKSDKELKNYWLKHTKILQKNLKKTIFIDRRGNKSSRHGVLHILLISSIFTEVIMGILNLLKRECLKSKVWTAAFLRGLMAADAHVKLTKWPNKTTLTMVELAIENEEESILYNQMFNRLGITTRTYLKSGKIDIMHWNNLKKLAEFKLLKLHPEKYEQFISGFNNHKKTIIVLSP